MSLYSCKKYICIQDLYLFKTYFRIFFKIVIVTGVMQLFLRIFFVEVKPGCMAQPNIMDQGNFFLHSHNFVNLKNILFKPCLFFSIPDYEI